MLAPNKKLASVTDIAPEGDRKDLQLWGERLKQAKNDRKRYEPTWHICQSFLAGRQWVGWNNRTRRVVQLDNPGDRERYTANVIDSYHQTVLGKLYVEDLRPEIMFRREDIESESITTHSRQLAKYAWDTETNAERRIYMILSKELCYGTSAGRCLYDKTQGDSAGQFPVGPDGQPMVDMGQATQYVSQAQEQGQQVPFQTINYGKVCWEVLSPFNMWPPPGDEDQDNFPWLIIGAPMSIQKASMSFNLPDNFPEQNLAVTDTLEAENISTSSGLEGSPSSAGQLKGHIMVYTGYEMPSKAHPDGRSFTWTENKKLGSEDKLPYDLRGRPHHGIVFFRYHMVPGRFWGKGIVEDLVGPQRQRNRARSQMIEMKDRNLGRVYARKGTITPSNEPVGKIMELVEIPMHADFPQETSGTPLGPWIENEAHMNDRDMDQISGIGEVTQGQTPSNVQAYSAMALLAEQDERRIGPVLKDIRQNVGDLVLLTLNLIRMYWPSGKRLAVSGPDGTMEEFIYSRAALPDEFYMDVSKNAPLPTSPAAESQKIFDIFNAAISAGQPLPPEWLKDSLDAGRPIPFPKREEQVQARKAEMEHYFLHAGQMIMPDPFDDDMLHLQIHRAERFNVQNAPGNEPYVMMLLEHEKMHVENASKKMPQTGPATSVPAMQGAHGAESQQGGVIDQAALAHSASGQAPLTAAGGPSGL
jgi:hypothetical protein